MQTALAPLTSCGHALDLSPEAFGELRDSSDHLARPADLRSRLDEDGYLFLRGYLDRDEVLTARASVTRRLAQAGCLDPASDPVKAVARPGGQPASRPELAMDNPLVKNIVHGAGVTQLYQSLFGAPVAYLDYVWFRSVGPGKGTNPHCDWVYMSRGSAKLLTCWIPYGDVSLELGGLMVLEGSHRQSARLRAYLSNDVDDYCANRPRHTETAAKGGWLRSGALSNNPASLREKLGGRWLTTEFAAGDLITFPMTLVHASLDNQTDRIRLSSDTRYQPADEPRDERWIGVHPVGHGAAGKRGRIC